jgi:toxin CcdB
MAQFDVYRNPSPTTGVAVPYLLDVQSDLLSEMRTRVVVPLAPVESVGRPAVSLNPVFRVEDTEVLMMTQHLAAVPRAALHNAVTSLSGEHDRIVAALDFLVLGF